MDQFQDHDTYLEELANGIKADKDGVYANYVAMLNEQDNLRSAKAAIEEQRLWNEWQKQDQMTRQQPQMVRQQPAYTQMVQQQQQNDTALWFRLAMMAFGFIVLGSLTAGGFIVIVFLVLVVMGICKIFGWVKRKVAQ
jgi:beta-lactamase superfamily II metal-dependent hydrolase